MKKGLFLSALLLGTTVSFAGGPDIPLIPINPFQGIYFAVGGSYDSVRILHTHIGVPLPNAPDVTLQNDTNYYDFISPDAQLGYNFAWNSCIFGISAKYTYLHFNDIFTGEGTGIIGGLVGAPGINFSMDHQLSLLATLGKTVANNLFYIDGGPSWFFTRSNLVDLMNTFPSENTPRTGNDKLGWMLGVGISHYFGENIIGNLNYNYSQANNVFSANAPVVVPSGDAFIPGIVTGKIRSVIINSVTASVGYIFSV